MLLLLDCASASRLIPCTALGKRFHLGGALFESPFKACVFIAVLLQQKHDEPRRVAWRVPTKEQFEKFILVWGADHVVGKAIAMIGLTHKPGCSMAPFSARASRTGKHVWTGASDKWRYPCLPLPVRMA